MNILDKPMLYQAQRERVLNQVIQAIRSSLDLETIFATAGEEIGKLLQVDHVKISQYLPDRKAWLTVAHYRSRPDLPVSIDQEIPDEGNAVTAQLKRLEIFRIDDTNLCQDEVSREIARTFPGAWLILPLHFRSSVWGSLCLLVDGHPHHWQEEEVELASMVAAQLAIAIQQWQLYQQVQQLSALAATQRVAHVGSWEFNALTGEISWSEEKFRILGLDPTEPEPTYAQIIEMIHPDDRASFEQALSRVRAGEKSYEVEYRIRRPDGQVRYIESKAEATFNDAGQLLQLLGTAMDITERKMTEEKLRKSEANLLAAQRIAHVGSWEFNALTGENTWSKEKFRIFGLDPAEPEPTYAQLVEMIHPDDRASFEQAVSRALKDGTSYEITFRIKRPNGQVRHIETRGEAIFNAAGQVIQLFGTVVDITERKLAEEETLKALQRERELSELKSRFIAMTSHDFRTPLTTIQSSVDLLRRYPEKLSSEKRLTHLDRISSAVEQMTQMMQDVLILSEAEAGKLQLNSTSLDLVQLCRSLVAELLVADKKQHQITFTHQGGCTATKTGTTSQESEKGVSTQYLLDEKLVRYMLANLLSNALKYSPQGSTVQLDLTCHQDQLVFRIQDQGIGILPEDIPHLFESFYRASNVGTTHGTGLGLAIVKQCVDLHGGEISVDSVVGEGTTFTVTLPLF